MLISVPSSALAIGSSLALIPACAFVFAILRRTCLEDRFLRNSLPGYTDYASRVRWGPIARWRMQKEDPCRTCNTNP